MTAFCLVRMKRLLAVLILIAAATLVHLTYPKISASVKRSNETGLPMQDTTAKGPLIPSAKTTASSGKPAKPSDSPGKPPDLHVKPSDIPGKPNVSGKPSDSYKTFPNMTMTVRTAATPRLLTQFYCMFLRTVVLFWPAMYGDMAIILDGESVNDRKFGDVISKQMAKNFPEYILRVHYEPLPKNPNTLNGKGKPPTYTRQIWSQFLTPLYTNESIVAYMDTDLLLLTSITKESLMNGTKLKVFGYGGFSSWVHSWDSATRKALGLPQVVNFMVTFPQLIHRDTYINCRQHILKHLGMTDFEKAFNTFHWRGSIMSPINVLLSYAWFFEKDRYDWHLKIPDIKYVNNRLPKDHQVQPEDTLPAMVPVAHISDVKKWLQEKVTPGYCMSMAAQGEPIPGCDKITHNYHSICDFYERDFSSPWLTQTPWCKDNSHDKCCEKAVSEHYVNVGCMKKMGVHTVQRKKADLVLTLAKEMGVTCDPLRMP